MSLPKGYKHSEETKKKISKNNARYWSGKSLLEETRKKLSKAHGGENFSLNTRENHRVAQRKWDKSHPIEKRIHNRNSARRKRLAVMELMGGKCVKCGFSDVRALQIDHVNGGGCQEKRGGGSHNYHIRVAKSILNKENKYQLLCANCNWIKRDTNNEVKIKQI